MDVDKIIQIPAFLAEPEADSSNGACGEYEAAPAAVCPSQTCSNICLTVTQSPCTPTTQGSCTSACERFVQYCKDCESTAQGCTTTCESSAQGCVSACEKNCQTTCESSCQTGCQASCQDACETSSQAPTTYGSLTVTGRTSTSISVRITSIPNATYYVIFCRLASETTAAEYTTTGLTYTITGLTPGTDYMLNYVGRSPYGLGPGMPSPVAARTLPAIEPWHWTSSNGSASAEQTGNAYRVLLGEIPVDSNFSHLVWNDLVDKVVEVQNAAGKSWTTTGGLTAAQCRVSAGDTLSARIYNSVKKNIEAFGETGISDVSRDNEELTGNHIIQLTGVLNSYINSM